MREKGRKVLLLMDNVASHHPDVELQNVCLHYLPPNTTSHLPPLDAGIIWSFKAHYRRMQVKLFIDLLEKDEKPDVSLKEAIRFIAQAWNLVSSQTISNCWKHSLGLVQQGEEDTTEDPNPDPAEELEGLLRSLDHASPMTFEQYLNTDNDLDTGDTLTDDDIVSLVLNAGEPEDDEEESTSSVEEHPIPTLAQALGAADILQKYLENTSHVQACFQMLGIKNILEQTAGKKKVQSTLDNFFDRQ